MGSDVDNARLASVVPMPTKPPRSVCTCATRNRPDIYVVVQPVLSLLRDTRWAS